MEFDRILERVAEPGLTNEHRAHLCLTTTMCTLRGSHLFIALLFKGLSMAQTQPCADALLFASDTQAPMWVETLWRKPNGNVEATAALFTELEARAPKDLFILGDVVNLSCKEKRWTKMDVYLQRLRERGGRVHALLGNHEVMGNAEAGERGFQSRFSDHVRTGYVVLKDSIAVVLLNSNFKSLGKADRSIQQAWYGSTLAALDTMPEVRTILVCCHHSPYSDSKVVGSNADVQNDFVQPFLRATKTSLFISGHAHIFQHFKLSGKHFFVIGGGGGLHHPLSRKKVELENVDPDYTPLFHYLSLALCGDHLHLQSLKLREDMSAFEVGREYYLGLPKGR